MKPTDICIKTASGVEELRGRLRTLSPRLRTILIMVDGARTVAELQVAASSLGAPEDCLDTLELQGLVAVVQPQVPGKPAPATGLPLASSVVDDGGIERFTSARKLMNDTAVDAMGFRAFLFTLKLERCSTTDDLRLLLAEFTQSLSKSRGELFARRATDHVRQLLG